MSRWIVPVLACLLPIGCISQNEYREMKKAYETQIDGLKQAVAAHERQESKLESDLAYTKEQTRMMEGQSSALKDTNALLMRQIEELNGKLSSFATEHGDIFEMENGHFVMKGDASFDSGLATLKPKAMAALDALATELRSIPNAVIRIDGHTDNEPIAKTKYKWTTASNFELAAARALTVLLYMEKQGIAGSQMFLTSYGEHHPRSANDTKEGKAKNRRVEIHIGTSSAPVPTDGGSTDATDHR